MRIIKIFFPLLFLVCLFQNPLSAQTLQLDYSTYLGGSELDQGYDLAVDTFGCSYVTGETFSVNFPTSDSYQDNLSGTSAAFVTKFNSSGSAVLYSTYLGGSGMEEGRGICVDSDQAAYAVGLYFIRRFSHLPSLTRRVWPIPPTKTPLSSNWPPPE